MSRESRHITYSADFRYLEIALNARWEPLNRVANEMASFQPRPASDWDAQRRMETERLTPLNPEASPESIASLVDRDISFWACPKTQFYETFKERVWSEFVVVVLLSHALCEAAINAMLALHLHDVGTTDRFNKLQWKDFREKWVTLPKMFANSYELPQDTPLHDTLAELAKCRKALGHYKVRLDSQGQRVLDGSDFKMPPLNECIDWTKRFLRLPYELAAHVNRFVGPGKFLGLLHGHPSSETPAE